VNSPNDRPRLIEVAFPLKQASLDSVHEKNVRHGHISTLHIWPARRPLAACRAALIATLLSDPGNDAERQRLLERLAGKVVTKNTTKRVGGRDVPVVKEETVGGILHWGRENGPDLEFFREEIRKVYGRPPRVLDPFAGGGAIPLEAMRLGCEATAIDINPVAWFILKCTLEYPQRLAGQTRPLPQFALDSREFMAEFLKQTGRAKKGRGRKDEGHQAPMLEAPEADLAWHVRAWGHWVLQRARADLERFYPTVDGKPTVAYLWARTLTCKNCRATLPLLKTLWLCRKEKKRYRLAMKPRADKSGVDFEVVEQPKVGGNAAQQRAHDRRAGQGTMSRSGAWCPVCPHGGPGTVAMTMDDIKAQGLAGRFGVQMTAVVVNGREGKEYRAPRPEDMEAAAAADDICEDRLRKLKHGPPLEALPGKERHRAVGSQLPDYGFLTWNDLFTRRQLLALASFVTHTEASVRALTAEGHGADWIEAIVSYLAAVIDKVAQYNSNLCTWIVSLEAMRDTFARFALCMTWDFAELAVINDVGGSYQAHVEWLGRTLDTFLAPFAAPSPSARLGSATELPAETYDVVATDPPYYDAIPYADIADFFYVWLRRTLLQSSPANWSEALSQPLTPKEGEIVQQVKSGPAGLEGKQRYEDGMSRAFQSASQVLRPDGRMVIVFAHKEPDAWETLVASMIRAGFVVNASWPIQTERSNRGRALTSASLSSSIWLVCRKRPETARPGWDNQVLEEMRSRIYDRLRDFWDAGIRGPDFVWAATGPALEAYSKHPVVKKADEPNAVLTVSEFLHHVRRIVVDYVVGRVLSRDGESEEAASLDSPTIYYLLHRHDFGFTEAPVGACILYAQSCGLRDRDLADRYDLVSFTSGSAGEEEEEETEDEEAEEEPEERGSGSKVRLKRWEQRRGKSLGLDAESRPAPLIDQVHRIMRLWREGDVQKVDAYIEDRGLRGNALFPRLLQALIELARKDNQPDERALLETIMNHVTARGAHPQMRLI